MREKDDIIGKDAVPIDPQLALPGWGEWGGEDESLNKKQQARLEDLHKQRKCGIACCLRLRGQYHFFEECLCCRRRVAFIDDAWQPPDSNRHLIDGSRLLAVYLLTVGGWLTNARPGVKQGYFTINCWDQRYRRASLPPMLQ